MTVCLLGFRFCFANMLCLLAWIFFLELKSNQSVFVTTMHFRRHQHHQHHHHPRYLSSSSSVARKVKRICKTPLSVFCSVCYRFLDFYLQYWKCNHLNHGGVVVVLSMHVRTCSCREVEGLSVCLQYLCVCLSAPYVWTASAESPTITDFAEASAVLKTPECVGGVGAQVIGFPTAVVHFVLTHTWRWRPCNIHTQVTRELQ